MKIACSFYFFQYFLKLRTIETAYLNKHLLSYKWPRGMGLVSVVEKIQIKKSVLSIRRFSFTKQYTIHAERQN